MDSQVKEEEGGKSPLAFLVQRLCVSFDLYHRHVEASAKYEVVEECGPHDIPLAIVGGSPSVVDHLEELRAWDGHIWSIKGAAKWLKHNGIDSTVVSCHPVYNGEDWPDYASAALLDAGCPPEVFGRFTVPVRIFKTDGLSKNSVSGSVTTLGKCPHLALMQGYRKIHFFGADSSMTSQSHAYENRHSPEQIIVTCNGEKFLTQADWVWQAEYLSDLCVKAPKNMINRSSGLMAAMVKSGGKYELSSVAAPLWERIRKAS